MPLVLTITLPLFCLILAGYVAARRGLVDPAGVRGITAFVFYFALPLLLFDTMATAPVAEHFDARFVLAYVAAEAGAFLAGMAAARWLFGCRFGEQVVHGLGATFGNTVFIALPIALAVFGQDAALPLALVIGVESVVVLPCTIALLDVARAGPDGAPPWRAPAAAMAAVVRSPIVMSVVAGAAVALSGLALPALAEGVIRLARGAAVPCALFALGATLAGMPVSERLRETGVMVALKLFAFPALVFGATALVPGVDPVWRAVAVLSAAAPTGANVYLVAAQYGTYVARASTAVLLSTVVSVATVSALAALLAPAPP